MIVGSTDFLQEYMSRFGSADNAKLLHLPVTLFLSEIDNDVTCFGFFYTFHGGSRRRRCRAVRVLDL